MITGPFPRILLAAAVAALLAVPAAAQGNSLYILQDNSAGGPSNALTIDQGAATRSGVGTPEAPVRQLGGGNAADIAITGSGSRAALDQQSLATRVEGNTVSVELNGTDLLGSVSQTGAGNSGTLRAAGTGAEAALIQEGDFNTGTVSVLGSGASGTLRQVGDGNDTGLDVTGDGTSVTYNVIGNGLVGLVPPSVRSNGATVTITQTGPGGAP